ncbi:MAG: WGR domain-containing protein [Saprospiraceae bacterium]
MLALIKNILTPTPPTNYLQSQPKPISVQSAASSPPPVPTGEPVTDIPLRKRAKLIMVTTANNNKFYKMEENADGTFTVQYGRVGSKATQRSYPMSKWESTYRSKVRKGYQDISALVNSQQSELELTAIQETTVKNLLTSLFRYARKSIQQNYYVSSKEVSIKQVATAQAILDELSEMVTAQLDFRSANELLLQLFQIIPRRMTKVKEHLISDEKIDEQILRIKKIISEEQETLDVMNAQVELNQKNATETTTEKIDILHQLGIQTTEVKDAKAIKMIKKMMGEDADLFVRAFAVTKPNTQQRFDDWQAKAKNKTTRLFWHGSRNENWLNILKTGLVLRPTNAVITGKMFGYGLYFADRFQKSLNYTSLCGSYWTDGSANTAFLALYDVHVGKQLEVNRHDSWCGQLTADRLKQRGSQYDSVYAKKGISLLNNEFIVYNTAQCTVRYLVEVKR